MRMCLKSVVAIILAMWITGCALHEASAPGPLLQPEKLRCEYLVNPIGIGEIKPRLSWIVDSSRRGDRQSGYQILVASSAELLAKDQGDLWDSGKVVSDEISHVQYGGAPLSSRATCFWKVRVWSPLDTIPTAWSDSSYWTLGLLDEKDWSAHWIDTHDAVMHELSRDPITITSAIYAPVSVPATTRSSAATQPVVLMDVTRKLSDMIESGMLTVVVNNQTMGGDPAPHVLKQIKVEYEQDGKVLKKTEDEKSTLSIPKLPTRLWYLRKSFTAKGPIRRATLYATALGLYDISINGQRVGDHVLAPDWTDYNKRVRYQAYDVTSIVTPAENAIGVLLANGWYAGHLGNGGFQQYGKEPALLAQLEITYADGSVDRVTTDASWKVHQSPVLASDFMLGESYDAAAEITGWDQPSLDAGKWDAASLRKETKRPLNDQVSPPVRETSLIKPIAMTEPAPGRWTFDMGQNFVGVVRLKVSAPAGSQITLHHAEMLNADGTIYTTNLRGAPSVDVYICKGGGDEIWQPRFTFHGFRYVEMTGFPGTPTMDAITGVVLGSDTPRTGTFSCSDSRVNQLMSNIQWGQRGNYLSVPTDCPQRDERLGWMGDAQVFVRTATDNADVASFFTKWLVDVDDAQNDGKFTDVSPRRGGGSGTPAWADAGVICPWTMYLAYGDKQILQQHLPAMTQWVDWCKTNSTDLIRDQRNSRGNDFGDWLSIHADTPKEVIGTAYFAYSAHLLSKAYAAVGNAGQAAKYQLLFEQIKSAFDKKYIAADGRIQGNTQCCYAMALKFELLPDDLRAKAAQYLIQDIQAKGGHLSTGFVGVSYLLPVLTQSGNVDVAYQLLLQDTFPSWLFSVKHGATTIWERWDGWTPDKGFQDPGMNSFNHYSLGSCGEWLYDTVAGIAWDPEQPGYKHILIHPRPGGSLTWAKATIESPYGPVSSAWNMKDGKFELNVVIPFNTSATICVPIQPAQIVTESAKPADKAPGVKFIRTENGTNKYEVSSGTYSFKVQKF